MNNLNVGDIVVTPLGMTTIDEIRAGSNVPIRTHGPLHTECWAENEVLKMQYLEIDSWRGLAAMPLEHFGKYRLHTQYEGEKAEMEKRFYRDNPCYFIGAGICVEYVNDVCMFRDIYILQNTITVSYYNPRTGLIDCCNIKAVKPL